MIPISVTLQGTIAHDNTTLDYRSIGQSAIAVCGENGVGKTAIIEAPFIALYGFSPFYSNGSIYDLMTQGSDGTASITLDFDHGGTLYRAERVLRDTGNSKSQKATLAYCASSPFEDDWPVIAGPKVKDFESAIRAMLGPPELALATWMLSQSRLGDLCGTTAQSNVGEIRREVFDHLIALSDLNPKHQRIVEEHKRAKAVAKELEDQLAGEQVESLDDAKTDLLGACETRTLRLGTLKSFEKGLDGARANLRDAEGDDAPLHAQIERYETAESARVSNVDAIGARQREMAESVERAAELEACRDDVARLANLRVDREDLIEWEKKFKAWNEWDRKRYDTQAEINNKLQVIDNAQRFTAIDEKTRELARRVESLRAEYAAKKSENDAIAHRNAERAVSRSRLTAAISTARSNIERIEKQLAEKPETPFGDKCAPCPLMQAWVGLPAELLDHKTKLHDIEYELGQVSPDEKLHDLESLVAEGQEAKAAADRVAKADEWRWKIDQAKKERDALDSRLADHAKTEPSKADDPAERLAGVRHEIDKMAGAEERMRAADEAGQRADMLRIELEKLEGRDRELTERALELGSAAASAEKSLEDREGQRTELRERVDACEKRVAEAREAVEMCNRDVARTEERIAAIERRTAERRGREERLKGLRLEIESLEWLRICYGPKGVKQIIRDAEVASLIDICDELCERATGGRMRINILTQRLLDDGVTTVEDFLIRVRDERGERDVLSYSGGQRNLIRILVRVGVLLWHERRTGQKAELLVLDEAFDAMDDENKFALLAVLDSVSDRIRQIIVVTHDPSLAARLPGRVFLERRAGGVEVTTGEPVMEGVAA
jgi:exonuclease SbcC